MIDAVDCRTLEEPALKGKAMHNGGLCGTAGVYGIR
ncbi:protein of unknown function [Xenorhabdus poinarii G6]|uniref:Uncharacterized protein n=1 Tax=Xenorhabdus poinarii G6 TaxID=1354304 RepID=A0A068QYV3_9GAMM|nr:protein of unknown function [Xenorhabdus poinarii G6]